ncbi:60S acidic ribosomal protein P2 [Cichlidogyrus casuarinus]|uniref:Large ribosomal subunit protein P2 n=1 Tax=Cichlidogyrus casuarinus TaxID=1844966 RepID=A0ABD2QLX3_9PLAT
MRYIAAYLLAQMGGKDKPTEADLKAIITSVGIDCEADKLKKIVTELGSKSVDQLITEGEKDLASVPSGGGGHAAPAAAGGAASAAADAGKKDEKKKPEPESESDEDIGMGLFG